MEQTVSQLLERLNKVELEYTVYARQREENVARAVKAIADIPTKDVELIKRIIPQITTIRAYTSKELMETAKGEVPMIHKAAADLSAHCDRRISFYEENL